MKRAMFVVVMLSIVPLTGRAALPQDASWTASFAAEPGDLGPTGRNPFFVLEPGYQLTLEDPKTRLVITVQNETRSIDGVETRIVEERETENDQPTEVSRNYFAISKRTNSVFYFGEDVDVYKNGKMVDHEGAWLSGVNGAKFGLMMPGLPLLHARYQQEIAPKIAMDRAEVVSLTDKLKTPAGDFSNVLKIDESSPLEPLVKESKYYARGIGLIQDGTLKLTKYSRSPGSLDPGYPGPEGPGLRLTGENPSVAARHER